MKAVILAGGQGKRIGSEQEGLPKALRLANGRPLVDYVLDALSFADETILVVGFNRNRIYEHLGNKCEYAVQEEQLGTGHALKCADEFYMDYDGPVLVTFADMPLLTSKTYRKVLSEYNKHLRNNDPAACVMLSVILNDADLPYGRIIRDEKGDYAKIVEERDCDDEQKKIREVFFGVMLFNGVKLHKAVKKLKNRNAQNEYYITDLPTILQEEGEKVVVCVIHDQDEVYGVNTLPDLHRMEEILKKRGEND